MQTSSSLCLYLVRVPFLGLFSSVCLFYPIQKGFVLLHLFVIYCYPLEVSLFSNERCEGDGYEQEGRCWN